MEFKKRDLFVEDKSEEGIVKKVLSKDLSKDELKNAINKCDTEIT